MSADPNAARTVRVRGRLFFSLLVIGLIAIVATGAMSAARSSKWWWDNLGGPSSSHYADLDQVNRSNVNQLEVAWFYPYGNASFNPIVVDDVMYVSGRNNSLIALDATSGKEIWKPRMLSQDERRMTKTHRL